MFLDHLKYVCNLDTHLKTWNSNKIERILYDKKYGGKSKLFKTTHLIRINYNCITETNCFECNLWKVNTVVQIILSKKMSNASKGNIQLEVVVGRDV